MLLSKITIQDLVSTDASEDEGEARATVAMAVSQRALKKHITAMDLQQNTFARLTIAMEALPKASKKPMQLATAR